MCTRVGPPIYRPSMLTVRDSMSIRLAAATYRYPAKRESDALEQLGMTAATFHRHVNVLIDRPDALAAFPREVRRLQRLRDARRRARAA